MNSENLPGLYRVRFYVPRTERIAVTEYPAVSLIDLKRRLAKQSGIVVQKIISLRPWFKEPPEES